MWNNIDFLFYQFVYITEAGECKNHFTEQVIVSKYNPPREGGHLATRKGKW